MTDDFTPDPRAELYLAARARQAFYEEAAKEARRKAMVELDRLRVALVAGGAPVAGVTRLVAATGFSRTSLKKLTEELNGAKRGRTGKEITRRAERKAKAIAIAIAIAIAAKEADAA